jgi:hypothetical protein
MPQFDRPIQTAPAVGAQLGIDRSTLTRAFNSGALKESAYRSGDTILIDASHPDFQAWLQKHNEWLDQHKELPQVKRMRKKQE